MRARIPIGRTETDKRRHEIDLFRRIGRGSKRDPQFAEMIEMACRYEKPVRIGVNWGSLDQDLLTRLMDENSRSQAPLDAQALRDGQ